MNLGICPIDGGPVTTPDVWTDVFPPIATCQKCGATAALYGRMIAAPPATKGPSPIVIAEQAAAAAAAAAGNPNPHGAP